MARIFVIDDDEQLLRMVGLMLERGGHTVTLVGDPIKGLEQLKIEKPDMLVVDVMMPHMSGHDVARQLRDSKDTENLPILILTARAQEIDRVTALKSGASDYLSKPVSSQELIDKVKTLLMEKPEKIEPAEGVVIAFYGLRGGVGQTTIAVNLAASLLRVSQESVALVDLTSSVGQVVMHMRLQARSSWANLPDENQLDWETLKGQMIAHQSGLQLLAAPSDPMPPDLPSAASTKKILELMRSNLQFTVIDLPHTFSPALIAGLESSDIVLQVLTPEMVSVQSAVQVNRTLAKMGMTFKQKSYILNHTTAEAQLPRATVERGLNARIAFKVGYDTNQSQALSQGVPLSLTSAKSPLPSIVNRMGDVIWQRVTSKKS